MKDLRKAKSNRTANQTNEIEKENNMPDAWDRLCLAVDGFRFRYKRWPLRVRMFPDSLKIIRDEILTSAGYALVTAKVELVPDETAPFIAEDDDGRQFNYNHDKREGDPDIPAAEWFGRPEVRDDELDLSILIDKDGSIVHIGKDLAVDPDAFPTLGIATGENYESNLTDAQSPPR